MNDPFELRPYPKIRRMVGATLRAARQKNIIHGLIEVDVTLVRRYMHECQLRTGETPSFTALIIACMGHAIAENPTVQAYRVGRKLYIYTNVDVTTQVEREEDGQKIVATHIVRDANEKSFWEIHKEIRRAQHDVLERQEVRRTQTILTKLPDFILWVYWWLIRRDIRLLRRFGAMVGITAVGMFADGAGWGIPVSFHSVNVTVGGIGEKPGVVNGRVEIREYLCLTLSFDHDIIDGAPATRFAQRLKELIESGYGLLEAEEQRELEIASNS
jgi:pyruvate/2-oxoglutarate dehydrogenase complex dihydrolipoamide acyltransferase (E2) component